MKTTRKRMKERIREMWVEALRSGEYKKGKGKLLRGDRYCCLGVLTDLYCKEKKLDTSVFISNDNLLRPVKLDTSVFISNDNLLRPVVVEWAGINAYNPYNPYNPSVLYRGNKMSLVRLNDGGESEKPLSFKKIADLIEEQL